VKPRPTSIFKNNNCAWTVADCYNPFFVLVYTSLFCFVLLRYTPIQVLTKERRPLLVLGWVTSGKTERCEPVSVNSSVLTFFWIAVIVLTHGRKTNQTKLYYLFGTITRLVTTFPSLSARNTLHWIIYVKIYRLTWQVDWLMVLKKHMLQLEQTTW